MRAVVFLSLAVLAACGAGARGELAEACMASPRSGATAAKCNCIQAVANRTLSVSDQSLAETFFTDPEKANDVKISDTPSADAFWERYRRFTDTAERSCR